MPCELYQYLACGKNVVTSDMPNLPECSAIYKSGSVAEVIDNIHMILSQGLNDMDNLEGQELARQNDWSIIAKNLQEDKYNQSTEEI